MNNIKTIFDYAWFSTISLSSFEYITPSLTTLQKVLLVTYLLICIDTFNSQLEYLLLFKVTNAEC